MEPIKNFIRDYDEFCNCIVSNKVPSFAKLFVPGQQAATTVKLVNSLALRVFGALIVIATAAPLAKAVIAGSALKTTISYGVACILGVDYMTVGGNISASRKGAKGAISAVADAFNHDIMRRGDGRVGYVFDVLENTILLKPLAIVLLRMSGQNNRGSV